MFVGTDAVEEGAGETRGDTVEAPPNIVRAILVPIPQPNPCFMLCQTPPDLCSTVTVCGTDAEGARDNTGVR